jgi:hypothetical protein
MGETVNSRRWRALPATGVLMASVVSACSSAAEAPATCGPQPTSTARLSGDYTVKLSAPARARTGSIIHPAIELAGTPRAGTVTELDSPARVVIVGNHMIIGAYRGAVGGTGISYTGSAPLDVLTLPLLLSGCPTSHPDAAHPDASRRPLTPGHYQLVAIVSVPPNQVLASAPADLTVTR